MGGECNRDSHNFLPQSSRLRISLHIPGLAQMGALHIDTCSLSLPVSLSHSQSLALLRPDMCFNQDPLVITFIDYSL